MNRRWIDQPMPRAIGALILVGLVSYGGDVTLAQPLDNKGTDFLVGFLPNLAGTGEKVELHLIGDISTMVTVRYPANSRR